jgi:hypothetical protein
VKTPRTSNRIPLDLEGGKGSKNCVGIGPGVAGPADPGMAAPNLWILLVGPSFFKAWEVSLTSNIQMFCADGYRRAAGKHIN